MITDLLVLFAALAGSLIIGLWMGLSLAGRTRPRGPAIPEEAEGTGVDREATVEEVVAREAALIEELNRARDDLAARARELTQANEEITCLLDELHEAHHALRAAAPLPELPGSRPLRDL